MSTLADCPSVRAQAATIATTGVDVRSVVAEGRVKSVYQPIVDLADGSVVGYEALARGPEGTPL
jgi:EAL domain-containing protein (putative c-di-GMP-specific phosphodiesterase class I)